MQETEVLIRNSESASFKGCRQAWQWGYVELLKPIREKSPLFFGSMAHEALEAYYIPGKKRGPHPARTFDRLWAEWLKSGGEEIMVGDYTAGELGHEMMINYVEEFGRDEWMEVIAPEMTFQVRVHHPTSGRYLFTFVGTIDGVIRDLRTGKIGFLEHKTGSSLEPFGAPLTLDDQNGSYWTFAPFFLVDQGIIDHVDDVDFMLYNRLRKAFKDRRPQNDDGHYLNAPSKDVLVASCNVMGVDAKGTIPVLKERLSEAGMTQREIELLGEPSKSQPQPLFKREYILRGPGDRRNVYNRTINVAKEMDLVRRKKLGVYKNPGKHCTYCDFRDMCEVHETGSDWHAIRDSQYRTWEPYDAHEIEMEGKR